MVKHSRFAKICESFPLECFDVYSILVIPQYEYNILVITQVRGEAEDAGNN